MPFLTLASVQQAAGSELVLRNSSVQLQSCFALKYLQDYVCNSLWTPAAMQVIGLPHQMHPAMATSRRTHSQMQLLL